MARPKSEDKRNAIMAAATRVIVSQGLSAPTALIAQEAGVANGSLFTYFETKTDLWNQLYLQLKAGMAAAVMAGLPEQAELRDQVFHIWSNWMNWALSNPEKQGVGRNALGCSARYLTVQLGGHNSSWTYCHPAFADRASVVEPARQL